MAKIGPSFATELAAAGLTGLPFSWSTNGELTYMPTITAEQRAAIEAVLAKHDPATPGPVLVDPRAQARKAIDAALAAKTPEAILAALQAVKATL